MNGAELSAVAKLGSGSAERLGHRPCSGAGARLVTLAALKRGDADETVGCLWGQGRRRKVRSWGEWFVCSARCGRGAGGAYL